MSKKLDQTGLGHVLLSVRQWVQNMDARMAGIMTVLKHLEDQGILPKDYVQTVVTSLNVEIPRAETSEPVIEDETKSVFLEKEFT